MKYISAEQFNKADEKVKDSVYTWWKDNINIGDLFESNIVYNMGMVYDFEKQNKDAILGNTTPLLTTQQLIDYIEHKLECTLGVEYNDRNMNVILVAYYVLDCLDNSVEKSKQEFDTDDLMQALWDSIQEINK